MKNKTQIEIALNELKDIKSKINQYDIFGDDNWVAIDTQIEILTNNFTENEIDEKYNDDNCYFAAMEVIYWLNDGFDNFYTAWHGKLNI
jgi:hypothetical protein